MAEEFIRSQSWNNPWMTNQMQTLPAASFALATHRFCLSSTLRQSTRQAFNSVLHLAQRTAIQAGHGLGTCVVPSVSNCLSFHHRVPECIFADHRVLAILAVDTRGLPGPWAALHFRAVSSGFLSALHRLRLTRQPVLYRELHRPARPPVLCQLPWSQPGGI